MKKSIIAIVVAAVSFASVSASAVEGGDQSQVVKSVIGEVLNAKADHANYGRAYEVVTRRLGYGEEQAAKFITSVWEGETVAQTEMTPAQAPAVDNSRHLDAPDYTAERNQARIDDAVNHANSVKDGKDGAQGVAGKKGATGERGEAGKDGNNGATGKAGVNGSNGSNGIDGKAGRDGLNGKDGVTTVRHELDTQTKAVVLSHSRAISNNSAAIERNSQRIDHNAKAIADNTKAIKRVGAMAAASANLHYNVNHSGYAVAAGEYKGSTAFAGGVQVQTSATTAITFQASYDGDSVGASVGFHGDF